MDWGWKTLHGPRDEAWWPYAEDMFGPTFAEVIACGVDNFMDDLDISLEDPDDFSGVAYYLPEGPEKHYDRTFYLKMRSVSHRFLHRLHTGTDIIAHMPIEEIIGNVIIEEAKTYVECMRDGAFQFPKRVINAVDCLADFRGDWFSDSDVLDLWNGSYWGGEYAFENWFKPTFWVKSTRRWLP